MTTSQTLAVARRFEPMLATTAKPPASLSGWMCEPKLDGWRAIVEVRHGKVTVTSRNGHDLTAQVPSTRQLAELDDAVLDGEIVHGNGSLSSFYGILGALHRGAVTFVAFDVLAIGADVLVHQPYLQRRAVLEALDLPTGRVPTFPGGDLDDLLGACESAGMEGVVLKRERSVYRPGQRSSDWRKVKCPAWREHLERRMAHHHTAIP